VFDSQRVAHKIIHHVYSSSVFLGGLCRIDRHDISVDLLVDILVVCNVHEI